MENIKITRLELETSIILLSSHGGTQSRCRKGSAVTKRALQKKFPPRGEGEERDVNAGDLDHSRQEVGKFKHI